MRWLGTRLALPQFLLLGAFYGALLSAGGCVPTESPGSESHPPDSLELAWAFVDQADVRRAALERSVAPFDTEYGRQRLQHYALEGEAPGELDWDALDVFEYQTRPLCVDNSACEPGPFGPVVDLQELASESADLEDFVAVGEKGFRLYPAQVAIAFSQLRDRETAESLGFFVGEGGLVHGAVEVLGVGDEPFVAITCAACHDKPTADGVITGVSNSELRFDPLLGTNQGARAGTMDVTADGNDNPLRPSDLRTISRQRRLHHTGNLANGIIERMVRVDTLIIGRLDYAGRPERRLSAAISLYLDSLAEGLSAPATDGTPFEQTCGHCHQGPDLAGAWASLEEVGTDPAATVGASRGTGGYRIPSLLGVGDRGSLLHDGSVSSLRELLHLDPSDHRGHRFGLDLSVEDREAIVDSLYRVDPRNDR